MSACIFRDCSLGVTDDRDAREAVDAFSSLQMQPGVAPALSLFPYSEGCAYRMSVKGTWSMEALGFGRG